MVIEEIKPFYMEPWGQLERDSTQHRSAYVESVSGIIKIKEFTISVCYQWWIYLYICQLISWLYIKLFCRQSMHGIFIMIMKYNAFSSWKQLNISKNTCMRPGGTWKNLDGWMLMCEISSWKNRILLNIGQEGNGQRKIERLKWVAHCTLKVRWVSLHTDKNR